MATQIVDRALAGLMLLLLSPLLVLIAVLVRTTSPGPAFYRQVRVGLDGRPFEIYKFRTMVVGADRLAANISPTDDPRVTRVGRTLRAWYLDELPQLFNVVKGDMGLVGPRPETPEYVALYSPAERQVLRVRPGIAGPSTLAFMDESERLAGAEDPAEHYENVLLHERVQADLAYLDQRSLGRDLLLLLRQVALVLRH